MDLKFAAKDKPQIALSKSLAVLIEIVHPYRMQAEFRPDPVNIKF